MSGFPTGRAPALPIINSFAVIQDYAGFDTQGPGSVAWPTANRAIYVPFSTNVPLIVTKMFAGNGGAAAGNIDIGIYSQDGRKLISTGSTAMAGTTTLQIISVTSTTLGPGSYWMALACSSTTAQFWFIAPSTVNTSFRGVLQQATALPLPASATFATAISGAIPLFGFTTAPNITI